MRKILLSLTTLLTLFFVGCQTDLTSDSNVGVGAQNSLTISIAPTRIHLGDKVGTTYPVYWSEGDKIAANGMESAAAEIKSEDPAKAQFSFASSLTYPCKVTYPYCSTTTVENPVVLFPAEQNYVEDSFACAPMCAYIKGSNEPIVMKHLAGVLRFPVKASKSGVILKKVVVTATSGAKIAGEFAVDCDKASLTANGGSNVVTYSLPANFALSTSEESVLYIALPAVEVGYCRVEFFDGNGDKMTSYWNGETLKAGIVREFKSIVYRAGTTASLSPFEVETDELEIRYPTVFGYVKDTNGNPVKGVAVSDGFSVVATDDKGYYSLDVSRDCWYIFISIPSEYKVDTNEYGQPCFFKKYPSNTPQYDFTLTPLPGGKEKKFAIFAIGDPQVSSSTKLSRFNKEAVPGLKAHSTELKAKGIPCYGITLGDIISNGDTSNTGAYRDDMRDGFHVDKAGMPIFQVMGNHDNTFYNSSQPIYADERNSTFELKAQREFEDMYGPVNYSFNRGDVHIVGMRDIVYTVNTSAAKYQGGFLRSQYEWLKQDLALVPKDKVVVLCVHIQLLNRTGNYVQEAFALMDQFKEAHIFSGHSHIMRNYEHTVEGTGHKIFEHNTCALCGCWWAAKIAGDGTPNGYQVFIGEGNTFTDWYYMGYSNGMNTKSCQMRLYRGNRAYGTAVTGTDTYGVKGYYGFNFDENVLLANVWNADAKWTIKVYEDGVYSGNMTKIAYGQPALSALVGDGSLANPRRPADGVVSSHDYYVTGLLLGTLGRNPSSAGSYSGCYHLYRYSLKNKNAAIKVVATDRFGNEYTETKIMESSDFSITK